MGKKMETTIMGLGFKVPWLGFRVIGVWGGNIGIMERKLETTI